MSLPSFRGERFFLSNFYSPAPVRVIHPAEGNARVFPTSEHGFVAGMAVHLEDFIAIQKAPTPQAAKKIGKSLKQRNRCHPDWYVLQPSGVPLNVEFMLFILRQKFTIPELRAKLNATGDEQLIEYNNWGGTFWGVCNEEGTNWLGKLLMMVREEIRGGKS